MRYLTAILVAFMLVATSCSSNKADEPKAEKKVSAGSYTTKILAPINSATDASDAQADRVAEQNRLMDEK